MKVIKFMLMYSTQSVLFRNVFVFTQPKKERKHFPRSIKGPKGSVEQISRAKPLAGPIVPILPSAQPNGRLFEV